MKWQVVTTPRPEAKPATVPCTMQEIFPSYAGLAWYWKEFTAPANPHAGGRCLLRFWAVDYKADVWLNGKWVGTHLDAEEPFTLDATEAIRPGNNLLAVRVLNRRTNRLTGSRVAIRSPVLRMECRAAAGTLAVFWIRWSCWLRRRCGLKIFTSSLTGKVAASKHMPISAMPERERPAYGWFFP